MRKYVAVVHNTCVQAVEAVGINHVVVLTLPTEQLNSGTILGITVRFFQYLYATTAQFCTQFLSKFNGLYMLFLHNIHSPYNYLKQMKNTLITYKKDGKTQ
jgi:hypothetical protein